MNGPKLDRARELISELEELINEVPIESDAPMDAAEVLIVAREIHTAHVDLERLCQTRRSA